MDPSEALARKAFRLAQNLRGHLNGVEPSVAVGALSTLLLNVVMEDTSEIGGEATPGEHTRVAARILMDTFADILEQTRTIPN
jgi:hypothetical protein